MRSRQVLVDLFQACNNGRSVSQLHSQVFKTGILHDTFFATKLNSLYAKYASLQAARKVFDETPHPNVHLWNSTLRSYCREKQWEETLRLFHLMIYTAGEAPDNFTIPIALKACAGLRMLELGKVIHGFAKKNDEIGSDMFVGSALLELYSKCGQMGEALKVFEEFQRPDTVLWTSMVTGYQQNNDPEEALALFSQMVMMDCVVLDPVTLVSVVSACAQLLNVKAGSCVHGLVIRREFDGDLPLVNSLLNLYAKTGCEKIAANLFSKMPEKDVISWSTMIACYANNEAANEALNLFHEMIEKRFEPNSVTVVSALQACAVSRNLEEGKKIHKIAVWKGFELDFSVSTALIDMYMKCSCPDEAVDLFQRLPKKDVVSWVALLSGYAQNGMAYKSMGVFHICCQMAFNLMLLLCLGDAVKLFKGMIVRDVVIWSSMIAAYGIHGRGGEALEIFDQMVKNSTVRPNNVTFLSILSACSHAGLVEEGLKIFDRMVHDYQLRPDSEHFGIMVDLLGRIGQLGKAMDIINRMPIPAGPHVWGALLGACRIHHNIEMGEVAAKNLFWLDPSHAGYYILLSNIYAVDGKWDNVAELRTRIKERGLKKMFGQSMVEVRGGVHSFLASDRFHPDSQKIYELLRKLEAQMDHATQRPQVQPPLAITSCTLATHIPWKVKAVYMRAHFRWLGHFWEIFPTYPFQAADMSKSNVPTSNDCYLEKLSFWKVSEDYKQSPSRRKMLS
ncbi:putative pentatricopeptide repeat-containing protein [Vitis vinifera]|uniref:Putative pentatricopeptide repeat-containing protein n=1 Tax=Vitis vinifera TaxID=29760 RepID=A0A438JII3_VITVI|nr:putative pentatricopeptide repeat-containing protein [Vitis vinifera]